MTHFPIGCMCFPVRWNTRGVRSLQLNCCSYNKRVDFHWGNAVGEVGNNNHCVPRMRLKGHQQLAMKTRDFENEKLSLHTGEIAWQIIKHLKVTFQLHAAACALVITSFTKRICKEKGDNEGIGTCVQAGSTNYTWANTVRTLEEVDMTSHFKKGIWVSPSYPLA